MTIRAAYPKSHSVLAGKTDMDCRDLRIDQPASAQVAIGLIIGGDNRTWLDRAYLNNLKKKKKQKTKQHFSVISIEFRIFGFMAVPGVSSVFLIVLNVQTCVCSCINTHTHTSLA